MKPTDHQPLLLDAPAALGLWVRARRKAQSLRIDDAAGLIGVSTDLLSRLENGQGSVRLDKAMAVLDGLGLALVVVPKEHPWARQAGRGDAPSNAADEPA